MADFITESDIRKYDGQKQVNFPLGTKLTPAAEDWAKTHHLQIVFGETLETAAKLIQDGEAEKTVLLHRVIETVVRLCKTDKPVQKDQLIPLVVTCLERLGHKIDG